MKNSLFYKNILYFLDDNLTRYRGKISVEDFQIINAPKIIKTLTSLIMCTPKVNITQAVGRILRCKENKSTIIDVGIKLIKKKNKIKFKIKGDVDFENVKKK